MTWQEYETGLEDRLVDLHSRVHRGAYRAQPSRRVYIPKADGRQRPLGIAALEDKIVQQAVVTILNQIYEVDFKGFSYGFRPGRSPHQALDALTVGIQRKRVNWVLDADIRGFFDNMSHEWTLKFVEHRVADRRILRLIQKWLKAGVSEDGQWSETKVGTPQGAVVSPLLANVYLHYVFDLWVEAWRKKVAKGDVIVVRYADDLVVGFQHRAEAERFLKEFRERLAKFGLELHADKTRLIEFGRFAARDRKQRGEGKPETFTFLGFTHFCGKRTDNGAFIVWRKTAKKRMVAKLQAIKAELRRRMHDARPRSVRGCRRCPGLLPIPCGSGELDRLRSSASVRGCGGAFLSVAVNARGCPGIGSPLLDPLDSRPRVLHPYPSTLRRQSSKVRAVCVNALVRICAGGDQRWSSLPRQQSVSFVARLVGGDSSADPSPPPTSGPARPESPAAARRACPASCVRSVIRTDERFLRFQPLQDTVLLQPEME